MRRCMDVYVRMYVYANIHTHMHTNTHITHPLFRPTSCQKEGEEAIEDTSACEDTDGETVVSVALVLMAMLEVTRSACCMAFCDPEQGRSSVYTHEVAQGTW